MIVDFLKNTLMNFGRYKTHSQAVIVACFFNPQVSPYRLLAFQKFFRSVRHVNHRIIECLIGDAKSQLPPNDENISRVRTESLLFHKETLLNKVISELPDEYRYVFWIDADVLFSNDRWLVESVEKLQDHVILQPFEYCIHLEANQLRPAFDVDAHRETVNVQSKRYKSMWRSFCANHLDHLSADLNYDRHGHVGFAWGARRELFEQTLARLRTAKMGDQGALYDKALIGGADHIIAHAAAGQIPHPRIRNSFTVNLKSGMVVDAGEQPTAEHRVEA